MRVLLRMEVIIITFVDRDLTTVESMVLEEMVQGQMEDLEEDLIPTEHLVMEMLESHL
jgi:hypothetical protein